jgi:hypothetical protein
VEKDSQFSGKLDLREYFGADNQVTSVEIDVN